MNKECPVTQDLLPLYEEDLLQPGTKQFVEEHLKSCQECRQIAEQSQIPLPVEVEQGGGSKKNDSENYAEVDNDPDFLCCDCLYIGDGDDRNE